MAARCTASLCRVATFTFRKAHWGRSLKFDMFGFWGSAQGSLLASHPEPLPKLELKFRQLSQADNKLRDEHSPSADGGRGNSATNSFLQTDEVMNSFINSFMSLFVSILTRSLAQFQHF